MVILPVGDVINEMLLEHKAPSLNDVKQSMFEWVGINSEPVLKDMYSLYLFNLIIYLLICVNLKDKNREFSTIRLLNYQ